MTLSNGERIAQALQPVIENYKENEDKKSKQIVHILTRICNDRIYFSCVVAAVSQLAKVDESFLILLSSQILNNVWILWDFDSMDNKDYASCAFLTRTAAEIERDNRNSKYKERWLTDHPDRATETWNYNHCYIGALSLD